MRTKTLNLQTLYIGSLLNVHTKFEPSSQIWREYMRGRNSKIREIVQKAGFLGL